MNPPDLQAIRLVTERYGSLQGLHLALNGAVIAVVIGGCFLLGVPGSISGFTACLTQAFTSAYLTHYYETRFGAVEQDDGDWMVKGLVVAFLLVVLILVYLGWNAGLLGLPFAVGHSWIVVRDFPRRTYHLVGTAGALVAASMLWASPSAGNQVSNWAPPLLGASMIVPGLLDHRLLVRTLQGGSASREDLDAETDCVGTAPSV